MAVKLHRCSNIWVKLPGHPCWKVQKALDETGGNVTQAARKLSGQKKFPVIEFDDGSTYREESKQMAEKIRAGQLFEQRQATSASPS